MRYSVLKNSVTGLENWVRGCCRSFKQAPLTLNNIMTLKSVLEVNQGHSDWYYSKAWLQFHSIHLP